MFRFLLPLLALTLLMDCNSEKTKASPASAPPLLKTGFWRAVLASPGGELAFSLKIENDGDGYRATVHNGDERLLLDRAQIDSNGEILLSIDHYESEFQAKLNESGTEMLGEWTKVSGADKLSRLPFHATFGQTERYPATSPEEPVDLAGRWAVSFDNNEGEPQPAVAEFQQSGNRLLGTFLTPTGDYRYLEGVVDGNQMVLSCFDGGHAFLFKAVLGEENHLQGDFWSRDTWHETWSAVRDETAVLEDPFHLTALKDDLTTFRFSFPDLEGNLVNQDDPRLQNRVRVISIFGSWCPNCNDEAPFLQELYEDYRERGLAVIGLAFEMTGDTERDIRVIKRFQKRHGLTYPILLAGGSTNKAQAARTLPDLNHVLAFPTTIFIDRQGKVAAIHTGFAGPGTGIHYQNLKRTVREKIESLL